MEGLERQVDFLGMVRGAGERLFMRLESVRAPGDETGLSVMVSDLSSQAGRS